MTKPNDAAFSRAAFYHPDGGFVPDQEGMTIREYFAAMAMQGILANPNTSHQIESQYGKIDANNANKILAYTATKLSDALIKALNESKPTENETTTNTH